MFDDDAEHSEATTFDEFDCPICYAPCPYPDGFGEGDEVLCYYCGATFKVKVLDGGKLKLREM